MSEINPEIERPRGQSTVGDGVRGASSVMSNPNEARLALSPSPQQLTELAHAHVDSTGITFSLGKAEFDKPTSSHQTLAEQVHCKLEKQLSPTGQAAFQIERSENGPLHEMIKKEEQSVELGIINKVRSEMPPSRIAALESDSKRYADLLNNGGTEYQPDSVESFQFNIGKETERWLSKH